MVDRQVEGPLQAVLGADQCLYGRSWARIRAYVGGLGSGSEPMWAVLRVHQGLCGRSWVRIRAYVGGHGRGSGPELTVLGHDQVGKWPKSEREDLSGEGIVSQCFRAPERLTHFFFRFVFFNEGTE